MKTEILPGDDPQAIGHALEILKDGGMVAFPTDTVYGLGALAFDRRAIEGLYAVKGRDNQKAIAVLLSSSQELAQIAANMGQVASRLAERFWPGPLTLVVPRHADLPSNLSPLPTIGVRMPDHPLALQLLSQSGPLAVTSANLSGASSTRTAGEVFDQLRGRIPLILDGGQTPGGRPSTVLDCTGDEWTILREGPVSLEDLLKALDR